MENEYIEKIFDTKLIDINEKLHYNSLKSLFFEIQQAYRDYGRLNITKNNKQKPLQTVLNDIRQHSGDYLPLPVVESIKTNYLDMIHVVEADLSPLVNNKCDIKITFFKMRNNNISESTLETYTKAILTWLVVAKKYETDKCLNYLNIDIYLTKEKKMLNSKFGDMYDANGGGKHNQLGSNNVNTALTYRCVNGNSTILLYRSEDLIKTFFHETFHTMNFDFANEAKQESKHIFNVNSPLRLFEAYCETWARIINVMYNVILLEPDMNWKIFNRNFRVLLSIESIYSMIQCCKILNYMNLTYNDVIDNTVYQKFNESSNVFSYYVITAIIMMQPDLFLTYCKENGINLLKFNESKLDVFIQLLSKMRMNPNIQEVEKNINEFGYKNRLKMAIFDIKN